MQKTTTAASRADGDPLKNAYTPGDLARRRRSRAAAARRWRLSSLADTAKRAIDIAVSLALLSALFPVMAAAAFLVRADGSALTTTTRIGAWGEPFHLLGFRTGEGRTGRFLERTGLKSLPVLFNVLKGDLSFIGPRAVVPGEVSARERLARRRFSVRPGLVSLWWIRKRANIDFGTELESDTEYASTQTVKGDLGIALRAVPTALYGANAGEMADDIVIQGIPIDNVTMGEAIDDLLRMTRDRRPKQICFVNAHCANVAWKDSSYHKVLTSSARIWADGIGVKLAGKILGRPIKQNVNGTDLFPRLCEAIAGTPERLYLLGAKPGIAEAVKDWIAERYPDTVVAGFQDGYYAPEDEPEVIARIAASNATILMVAFGVPRQDVWIAENLDRLGVRVAMGVGGLFDFYSGKVDRAPQWVREIGFEWLFRVIQEPGRMWRRYFVGNAVFLAHVWQEKLFGKTPHGRRPSSKETGE